MEGRPKKSAFFYIPVSTHIPELSTKAHLK